MRNQPASFGQSPTERCPSREDFCLLNHVCAVATRELHRENQGLYTLPAGLRIMNYMSAVMILYELRTLKLVMAKKLVIQLWLPLQLTDSPN